jgi:Holliday junction resolvase RusA-like endonuclease
METETVPHTKKPDTDNCVKSVTDGAQGVAFDDDKQIYKIVAEKYYSNNPRAEIELREQNEG